MSRPLMGAFLKADWEKCSQIIELSRERQLAENAESEARSRREQIDKKIASFTGAVEPAKEFKGRKTQLRVTRGSIRNSYLLVTRALDDSLLDPAEELTIHCPATGETFVTGIYGQNKYLKERHKIGEFYEAAGISRGDWVLLEETAPGKWRLLKSQPDSPRQADGTALILATAPQPASNGVVAPNTDTP